MIKIICTLFCIILLAIEGKSYIFAPITDRLYPAQSAKVNGYIGSKLDLSYQNRVLAQDYERLIAPFNNRTETTCWQSEFWGKWFTSAVLAYRYRPEPQLRQVLDKAVAGLIATQTPDGYIGNYSNERRLEGWDIWGRKYCMLGLIAYYDLTKDQKALNCAAKEADFLIKELADRNALLVKKGAHRGMAASSVMEPICLLYTRTGNKKYLDFAEEIVREWETPDGPQLISKASVDVAKRFPVPEVWYGPLQGQKAYEMMSCYEGLLELYRITGKEQYRTAVEKTWQNIRDTEINIAGSGSAMECWFGGKELQTIGVHHFQETCVTATWIKLSQQLLRLTGEAKYADAIEQAYYNALLGAMKPDGSAWAYYSPLSGYRVERAEQCNMGTNCCNASGPRGLFTLPLTTVMTGKEGLQVNFYADGVYNIETPGKQKGEIIQQTDYPVSGKVSMKIQLPRTEEMTLRIRIPEWSKKSGIKVNGESIEGFVAGEYASIKRKWKSDDEIILDLDMRGRVIKLGKNPENVAICRGPVVLARDTRLGGPVIDAWITPDSDKENYINLELTEQNQNNIWMKFKLMGKAESLNIDNNKSEPLIFCDFASAGNTYNSESRFRVWLPQMLDPRLKK